MLKEISKSDAIEKISKSEDILIYHSKLKRMFTWKEFLDCGRFLIDEEITISDDIDTTANIDTTEKVVKTINNGAVFQNTMNDVKTQVEDTGYVDTSLKSESKTWGPTKKRRITIDLGKLYALKNAGWNNKAIAEELQCSVATIYKYINDAVLENQVMKLQHSSN